MLICNKHYFVFHSMKVLSIDIGIKHMAHCLFDVSDSITIDDWDVIDLTDEYTCACSKQATHQLNQTYYCKSHSTHASKTLVELISLCTKHALPLGTSSEMVKTLKRATIPISTLSLVDLGKQLIRRYAKFAVDLVLIENQIGPLASKMKSIQGLMVQYWLMRGAEVECISACNKLKLFHTEKTTYAERKKLSIHYTKQLLELNNFKTSFLTHKKKDDLADTFLQGIWYFHNNNCGLLKINCS
jgi:hypothetical protein